VPAGGLAAAGEDLGLRREVRWPWLPGNRADRAARAIGVTGHLGVIGPAGVTGAVGVTRSGGVTGAAGVIRSGNVVRSGGVTGAAGIVRSGGVVRAVGERRLRVRWAPAPAWPAAADTRGHGAPQPRRDRDRRRGSGGLGVRRGRRRGLAAAPGAAPPGPVLTCLPASAGRPAGARIVVPERLRADDFWLPAGVYADHWALREGTPVLTARQLLALPGVVDLAGGRGQHLLGV